MTWWVLTAALLVVAAGALIAGFRGDVGVPPDRTVPGFAASSVSPAVDPAETAPSTASTRPSASSGAGLVTQPASGSARPGPPAAAGRPPERAVSLDRSAPTQLRIPAIGLAVALSTLGLNPDRTVQVPTAFQEAGWFAPGPSPGQVGSAVILGHVDSYRGPAVFYRLRSLKAGDRVEVSLTDGAVAHFVVDLVATYPKTQFPAQQVYASHGFSALQLVTCGGQFDSHARSYLSNVVAYTSFVGVTRPSTGT